MVFVGVRTGHVRRLYVVHTHTAPCTLALTFGLCSRQQQPGCVRRVLLGDQLIARVYPRPVIIAHMPGGRAFMRYDRRVWDLVLGLLVLDAKFLSAGLD